MTPSPAPRSTPRSQSIAGLQRGLPCGSAAPGNKKARSGFHRACFGSDQNNSLKRSLQVERGSSIPRIGELGIADCGFFD